MKKGKNENSKNLKFQSQSLSFDPKKINSTNFGFDIGIFGYDKREFILRWDKSYMI